MGSNSGILEGVVPIEVKLLGVGKVSEDGKLEGIGTSRVSGFIR